MATFRHLLRKARGDGYGLNKFSWYKGLYTSVWLRATEGEERLTRILTEKLNPTYIDVVDISGGCGSMYQISVDTELFQGLKMLHQHRMVNEALGDEVKALHGLTLRTGKSARQ